MVVVLSVDETPRVLFVALPSSVEPMMFVSRSFSEAVVSPSATPFLDSEPYRTVPLLNVRSTLLALMISFLVTSPTHRPHVPATKLTLSAGIIMDMLLSEAVYPLCHPPHARM